jgi:hypothetical protein
MSWDAFNTGTSEFYVGFGELDGVSLHSTSDSEICFVVKLELSYYCRY